MKLWGLALLSQLATAYRGGDVLHESFKGKKEDFDKLKFNIKTGAKSRSK